MRLISRILLLAAIAACAALAGAGAARWYNPQKAGGVSLLAVADSDLDLGPRYLPGRSLHTFRVQNVSGSEVHIEGFATTCNCAAVRPRGDIRLAAGDAVECVVELALTASGRMAGPERLGVLARCHSGGRSVLVEWGLRYTSVPLMWPLPRGLDVGTVSRDGGPIIKTVTVNVARAVKSLAVSPPPGWQAETTVEPGPAGSRRYTVTLRVSGSLSPRTVADEVAIEARGEDNAVLGRHTFRIIGAIKDDVVAEPADAHFGRMRRGERGEREVTLRSLLDRPFVV